MARSFSLALRLHETMTMVRNFLRFSALAIAAFFSLATSMAYDEVESITPLHDESAVPVDEIPTVRATTEIDLGVASVSLVRAFDDRQVPGAVQQPQVDGYHELRFVPEAPLEPDTDYRFIVAGGLDGYLYYDPITNESTTFGGTNPDRLEVEFTTRSAPAVRHTRRFDGHAHIYLSFSQDMNINSFNSETVRVFLDGVEEEPLTIAYPGGPAHNLDITMRRVDFTDAEVSFDGVEAIDGTVMSPVTVEIAPPM